MEDWKEALKDLMLIKTQDEIAQNVGVSQTYVSFLLKGRKKNPSYSIAKGLITLQHQNMEAIRNKKALVVGRN